MTQTNSRFGRRTVFASASLGLAAILGMTAAFAAPQPGSQSTPPAPAVPTPAVPAPVAPVYPAPTAPADITSVGAMERGVTKPSDQSDLYFPIPGVISKVMVKAGDTVKANQLIAQQDDRAEAAKVAESQAFADAEKLQIDAADADLEQKIILRKRAEDLYKSEMDRGLPPNNEVLEARVNVKIAEIALKYRNSSWEKAKATVATEKVTLEQRKLMAPINGVIAKVDLHAGEGTDIQRPAGIQIVQNDPLWVEVNVPVAKADSLRLGQDLPVQYVDGGDPIPAKIILLAPVANAGANVRMVRLQMPNPVRKDGTQRESGRQVFVKLPEPVAGAQAVR